VQKVRTANKSITLEVKKVARKNSQNFSEVKSKKRACLKHEIGNSNSSVKPLSLVSDEVVMMKIFVLELQVTPDYF
jgi:hypothetical protein